MCRGTMKCAAKLALPADFLDIIRGGHSRVAPGQPGLTDGRADLPSSPPWLIDDDRLYVKLVTVSYTLSGY